MKNNFFNEPIDENSFTSFLNDIQNFKVGFYSVGLYPASLAYNIAMHSKKENVLLAPRPNRDLLGAFSKEVLAEMDKNIIKKILKMGFSSIKGSLEKENTLSSLIVNCNIVFLSSNSNHIQDDINLAMKLRKDLNRENVVLTCLVGSFCIDDNENKPFILCEKYPNLAFLTGFHRHGALRNVGDSFSANFCHPNSLTAFLGAQILNELSPKIQVSAGVHNIECQYIKAMKNVSSIFAGFASSYHSNKPGMLPTINTLLLSQCFDQAASVSCLVRKKNRLNYDFISLKELGYGAEMIKAYENIDDKNLEVRDYTFSQLNAVKADVLGSMSMPIKGNPTRNFQAGQVLSEMLLNLKRCPIDINEFIEWCNKFSLKKGALEGLKSLKFWPKIYKQYKISNNNSSMINLIYLCFYATKDEKKDIYKVLINEVEMTNYCKHSAKPINFLDGENEIENIDMFSSLEKLYKNIFEKIINSKDEVIQNSKNEIHTNGNYFKVIKLVNKYFSN
tara:strand:- start:3252 stop:4763 length:1512 start_codon:yes stop_codon:yes gene_type:complete